MSWRAAAFGDAVEPHAAATRPSTTTSRARMGHLRPSAIQRAAPNGSPSAHRGRDPERRRPIDLRLDPHDEAPLLPDERVAGQPQALGHDADPILVEELVRLTLQPESGTAVHLEALEARVLVDHLAEELRRDRSAAELRDDRAHPGLR